MKFGCSTLLFGGFDLATALQNIAETGYEAVELASIPGMAEHFRGGECSCAYGEISEMLEAQGLALESVGCSGALGDERFEPLMEAAAELKAPYMTVGSGGVSDDEEGWTQTMEVMRAAIPVCKRTGVKLSVKPHVRASVYSIDSSRRFMEEIDSEWIGLNLDNTHLQRVGDDPIEAVRALAPWIFTARIRDFRSDDLSIGSVESQIPGKGMADVKGYYRALTEVPGLEYVAVEMVGTKDFELDEVRRVAGETCGAICPSG